MQNNTLQRTYFLRWLLPVAVYALLLVASTAVAATTITNSVRVSADGSSGQSHAAVTTVVNGEVVEDWTATSDEPISYTHSFATTSTSVQTQATADTQSPERDQLVELIAHLQALIALYVSLLTH